MKQGGVEERRLLSAKPTDDLGWRCLDVERFQFTRDGIQAIEGRAVVMFVVALDETGRHVVQRPGTAEEGGDAVCHRRPPFEIENMSFSLPHGRRGTLSAAPRGQATANVSRIEAALPQRRRHVATNFEAVGAVHEHRGPG